MVRNTTENDNLCLRTSTCKSGVKHDPRLPNYAQATISSSKHTSQGNPLESSPHLGRLKAGASKSNTITMRPTSARSFLTLRSQRGKEQDLNKLNANDTPLRRPEFADLFYSPTKKEIGGGVRAGVSGSLRKKDSKLLSPSLSNRIVKQYSEADLKDMELQSIIRETDSLIDQIKEGSDEQEFLKSLEFYKSKVEGQQHISVGDWTSLIEHHSETVQKLQRTLHLDYKLIHNVLEINNSVSKKCTLYKKELEKAKKELTELKAQFRTNRATDKYFNGYGDVFRTPSESNDAAIVISDENFQRTPQSHVVYNYNHSASFQDLKKQKSFTGSDSFISSEVTQLNLGDVSSFFGDLQISQIEGALHEINPNISRELINQSFYEHIYH